MKVFNISSSRGLRFFWPSLLIYLATASSALAQMPACGYFDSFVDGETGTFVDPRDGLIWAQCALGQGLISNSCKGRPMKLSWSEAMQAAKNYRQNGHADWRLPSLDELRNVTVHGFKQVSSCKFNGGRFSQRFGKQLGDVWSYNLNTFEEVVRGGGSAGVYNFSTWSSGDAGYKIPTSEQNVWLVRGGSPSNSVQFSEAYTAILKSEQYLRDVAAEKVKIQAESERSAREYEAKQAKDLAAFNSLLRSTNPRGMYLSAVKLEDSGDRGKAKTVYREMINRFPNAQETLLASQRLMRLGDVEAVESSNNDAVSRAEAATQGLRTQNYQQCIAEESSCYSRCSDIKNSSAASNCRGGCYRGCKQ